MFSAECAVDLICMCTSELANFYRGNKKYNCISMKVNCVIPINFSSSTPRTARDYEIKKSLQPFFIKINQHTIYHLTNQRMKMIRNTMNLTRTKLMKMKSLQMKMRNLHHLRNHLPLWAMRVLQLPLITQVNPPSN